MHVPLVDHHMSFTPEKLKHMQLGNLYGTTHRQTPEGTRIKSLRDGYVHEQLRFLNTLSVIGELVKTVGEQE